MLVKPESVKIKYFLDNCGYLSGMKVKYLREMQLKGWTKMFSVRRQFVFEVVLPLMTWWLLQVKRLSLSCCYELKTLVTGQLQRPRKQKLLLCWAVVLYLATECYDSWRCRAHNESEGRELYVHTHTHKTSIHSVSALFYISSCSNTKPSAPKFCSFTEIRFVSLAFKLNILTLNIWLNKHVTCMHLPFLSNAF